MIKNRFRLLTLFVVVALVLSFIHIDSFADTNTTKMPVLQEAKVTKVVDGDTVYVKISGKEYKVRLIGVDTPESTTTIEPYGKEASKYTTSKLLNKTVYLEKDAGDKDKYSRLLRYLYIAKPKDMSDSEIRSKQFNAILVLEGFANSMTIQPNVRYQSYYLKFEQEARKNNKGLWGLSVNNCTNTQTTSTTQTNISKAVYVGSKESNKFHYPSCVWAKKITPSNLLNFKSKQDALDSKYVPCAVCKP